MAGFTQKTIGVNLLIFNLVFSFIAVGQVWLVQLSAYPLFAHVGPEEFADYHTFWWHSIWIPLFIPVGITIACLIAMLWYRPQRVPRWSVWAGIGIQVIIYTLTLIWWAPLMAVLGVSQEEFQEV